MILNNATICPAITSFQSFNINSAKEEKKTKADEFLESHFMIFILLKAS